MSVGRGRPAPGAVPVSPGRRPCSRGPEDSGAPAALPSPEPGSRDRLCPLRRARGPPESGGPTRTVSSTTEARPPADGARRPPSGDAPPRFDMAGRWSALPFGRWSGCVDDGCRRPAATRGVYRGHRDRGAEPWIALEDHGVAQRRIHLPDRPCGRLGLGGGHDSGPGGGTRGFRDRVADQLTEQCVADQRPAPRRSADRHGSARVGGGGRRCVHLSRGTGPRGRGGTEFGWCGVRPPDGLRRLGGESPRPPAGARRAARVTRVGPGAVGAVRGRRRIRR